MDVYFDNKNARFNFLKSFVVRVSNIKNINCNKNTECLVGNFWKKKISINLQWRSINDINDERALVSWVRVVRVAFFFLHSFFFYISIEFNFIEWNLVLQQLLACLYRINQLKFNYTLCTQNVYFFSPCHWLDKESKPHLQVQSHTSQNVSNFLFSLSHFSPKKRKNQMDFMC